MKSIPFPTPIPDAHDWEGYESDMDAGYLHKLVFGWPIPEVMHLFKDNSIERMTELLFTPQRAFQYYVHAFGQYLLTEDAAGESDAASPFLALLEAREERDPGSVSEIFASLVPYVDFVAARQDYFDVPEDIYGNFRDRAHHIRVVCGFDPVPPA